MPCPGANGRREGLLRLLPLSPDREAVSACSAYQCIGTAELTWTSLCERGCCEPRRPRGPVAVSSAPIGNSAVCVSRAADGVAQVSNLLYRRFPIGRTPADSRAHENSHDPQAGSTAIQQVGNLRYLVSSDNLNGTWTAHSSVQGLCAPRGSVRGYFRNELAKSSVATLTTFFSTLDSAINWFNFLSHAAPSIGKSIACPSNDEYTITFASSTE